MYIEITTTQGSILWTKDKVCKEDITVIPQLETITATENNKTYTPTTGKCGIESIKVQIPETAGVEAIDTDAGMAAVLSAGNVGKYYLFTGDGSTTYVKGDIYQVEEVSS